MFKDLSKSKLWLRILIKVCCALSFVPAYLVYVFGFMSTSDMSMTIVYIFAMGMMGYILFEVVNALSHKLCNRFIPNFALSRRDYGYILSIFVIFKNIVYSLINIAFILNPVISVWGILINYFVTTTISMTVMYFVIIKTYNLYQYKNIYLNRFASIYSAYLIIYLLVGALV